MKIELGKRYERRDGVITGPMRQNTGAYANEYPFRDTQYLHSYSQDGKFRADGTTHLDLISEYEEASVPASLSKRLEGFTSAELETEIRRRHNRVPIVKEIASLEKQLANLKARLAAIDGEEKA